MRKMKKLVAWLLTFAMMVTLLPNMMFSVHAAHLVGYASLVVHVEHVGETFQFAPVMGGTGYHVYRLRFEASSPNTFNSLGVVLSYDTSLITLVNHAHSPALPPYINAADVSPTGTAMLRDYAPGGIAFTNPASGWYTTASLPGRQIFAREIVANDSAAADTPGNMFALYFRLPHNVRWSDIPADTFRFEAPESIPELAATTLHSSVLIAGGAVSHRFAPRPAGTPPHTLMDAARISGGVFVPGQATPLTFTHQAGFNIPASTIGTAITNIDVAPGAAGGVGTRTFSATDLPDGITISAAGVISGTPTTAGAAGSATITVTDSATPTPATANITIAFGAISYPLREVTWTSAVTAGTLTATTPSGTITSGANVEVGTVITFTIAPTTANWVLAAPADWSGSLTGTGALSRTIAVTAGAGAQALGNVVTAVFEAPPPGNYAVNIGGTAAAQTTIDPASPVTEGQTVNVTVTAPNGQRFTTAGGGTIAVTATGVAGFNLTVSADRLTAIGSFTMPSSSVDLTVNATFEVPPREVTWTSAVTAGTLTATTPSGTITSGANVDVGTVITFTIAPTTANWVLAAPADWSGSLTGTGALSRTIAVTAGAGAQALGNVVTAVFEAPQLGVVFTGVTANGSATETSTQLTLTFSAPITATITSTDITIPGVTVGAVTGTGTGNTRTVAISGTWADNASVNVSVANPTGGNYTISGSPQPVTLRWFTPVAPTITLQPTNQTAAIGQNATFVSGATGNPAPTFQWEYSTNSGGSWANVVGATTTTLTLPAVTSAMSGNQYRLVATNSEGSAISNSATLAVVSNDATLSALTVSGANALPNAAPPVPGFAHTVGYGISNVTIVATPNHLGANAVVTATAPATVGAGNVISNLPVGATTITTTVTAEDGITTRLYTITVTRSPAPAPNIVLMHGDPLTTLTSFEFVPAVTLDALGNVTTTPAALTITVINTGDAPTTSDLAVSLSGANASSFVLGNAPIIIPTLAPGASATFTLEVASSGLVAGTHNATVTVFGGGLTAVFTAQVEVIPYGTAPTITGPTAMSLNVGYATTHTTAFTLTGTPTPTVTLNNTHGGFITWDNAQNRLNLLSGLTAGTYVVVLTASNGILPNATHSFTLTVNAPIQQLPPQQPWTPSRPSGGTGTVVVPQRSIPANNNALTVQARESNNRFTFTIPNARINDLVRTAVDNTVIFDLNNFPNATTAILPRVALQRFVDEGLGLKFLSTHGVMELSASELAELIQGITTSNVTLPLVFDELYVPGPDYYEYNGVEPPLPLDVLRFAIGSRVYSLNEIPRTMDAEPFIDNGRTMVPIRFIVEAMGAVISWNGETRTVTIIQGSTQLQLVIDEPLPDGMGTAVIVDSRTFVPLRYVSEELGAVVRWDSDARAVYIYF